jgi:hypothetical protein
MTEHWKRVRNLACPTCNAKTGDLCVTCVGTPMRRPHAARLRAAEDIGAIPKESVHPTTCATCEDITDAAVRYAVNRYIAWQQAERTSKDRHAEHLQALRRLSPAQVRAYEGSVRPDFRLTLPKTTRSE